MVTRSQIQAQVNAELPDNSTRSITPSKVRAAFTDVIEGIIPDPTGNAGKVIGLAPDGTGNIEYINPSQGSDLGTNGGVVYLRDSVDLDVTGATDVSALIQACVTALPSEGGTVILPAGKLGIANTVTTAGKAVRFVGQGTGVVAADGVTTIVALADVMAFHLQNRRSAVESMGFDGSGVTTMTTPAVQVGGSSYNARGCDLIQLGISRWGAGVYWKHGSHLYVKGVQIGNCPQGGLMCDPDGNDAHHGTFIDLQVTYCQVAGISFGNSTRGLNSDGTSNHRFVNVKVFGCDPVYFNASGCWGAIFVEQTNSARATVAFGSGVTTLTSVPDDFFYNLFVGSRIIGNGIASQTFVTGFDSTAKTVTLSRATSSSQSGSFLTASLLGANRRAAIHYGPLAGENNIFVDGDSVDPTTVDFEDGGTDWDAPHAEYGILNTREARFSAWRQFIPDANLEGNRYGISFLGTFTNGNPTITGVPSNVFKSINSNGFNQIGGQAITGTVTVLSADPAAQTITMSANAIASGDYYCNIATSLQGSIRGLAFGNASSNTIFRFGEFIDGNYSVEKWIGLEGACYRGTITNGSATITNVVKVDTKISNGIANGFKIHSPYFAEGTTISSFDLNAGTITMNAAASTGGATICGENSYFYRNSASTYTLGWMGGMRSYAGNSTAISGGMRLGQLYAIPTGGIRQVVDATQDGRYEVVWDIPSLAAGESINFGAFTTDSNGKALANVSLGDFVAVSCNINASGLILTPVVTATNTMDLWATNITSGAKDLANARFNLQNTKK